ncbi:MAG: hypothetical protein AAB383_03745 [Patescibacteria group bacterium]
MSEFENSGQKLDSLQQGTEQLNEKLTDVKEGYDEALDLREMAVQLSEVRDQGIGLLRQTEAFGKELQGPGENDHATIERVEALQASLVQLLDEEIPQLLLQRSYEDRDNRVFGKGGIGENSKIHNEEQVVHEANMQMYPAYLELLEDLAVDGVILEPIFDEALKCATSELDADGVVREWQAMSADTENLPVDKKWIAARPKVADRIVKVYLAALNHPDMRRDGEDYPRLQEFEELLQRYDLLNVIGSPLKEKYQKQLDTIKTA